MRPIVAGKSNEKYTGWGYWVDSDLYKTLEGMIYCLRQNPDPAREKQMEQIIANIIDAQEDDGYLSPFLQTKEPNYEHFSEDISRTAELYSMGHMIESAVAHFEATGRRNYLNAAIKLADLIDRTYPSLSASCPCFPVRTRLTFYCGQKKTEMTRTAQIALGVGPKGGPR